MLKLKKITLGDLHHLSVKLHYRQTFVDRRGSLSIDFEGDVIAGDPHIAIKTSTSVKGVARGLHYQGVHSPQTKIISVLKGELIDFIYDPQDTSGVVYGFEMDSSLGVSAVIPPNFAHGFIAKSDVVFNYVCLGRYAEADEKIYNLLGSAADILGLGKVLLSEKDASSPPLNLSF